MEDLIRHPPPLLHDENCDDDEDEDKVKDSLEIASRLNTNDPFLHISKLLKFCEPCSTSQHNPQHPFAPYSSAAASSAAVAVEESRDAPRCTREAAAAASEGGHNSARTGVEMSSNSIGTTIDWWALRLEEVKGAAGSKMEEVKKTAVNFLEHANDQFQKFNETKERQKAVAALAKMEPRKTKNEETSETALSPASTERRSSPMSDGEINSDYEDDDSVHAYVIITEMDDSFAARIYQSLETLFVAVLIFAVAMHILKRLGGVFAIERRSDPTVNIMEDGLDDVCGEQDEYQFFSFISFVPKNYQH